MPFLIQPDYRIRMLQSGPSIIFRPGIWYLQLAFSAIGRTWCEPYGLKDPFDQEFIRTTDSINCLLVILDFSPSFSCKPRSQCSSASSSSLSFCSLQSLQTHCPPRSPLVMIPNAIMIAARYAIPSMAPTKTLASESKSYLIVNNINTNWLLFDCSNCTCVSMVNDTQ
jgi:hypothetical protein